MYIKPRILLIGATGLLGSSWAQFAKGAYEVIGTLHEREHRLAGVNYCHLNLDDCNKLKSTIVETRAQIVINCMGMTNVDECEVNPERAHYCNVVLAENIAISCATTKVKFVHISTDHVFDGSQAMRTETDVTEAVNTYARTKILGEERVLRACPNALIIRTNFYGIGTYYRRSFSDLILDKLRSHQPIYLFTDAFFTPILMENLFEDTHSLLDGKECGIFNVVGDVRVSKFEFGVSVAKVFNLDESLIRPSLLTDRKDLTLRPLDLSLSNDKLYSVIDKVRCSLRAELAQLKQLEIERAYS